MDGSDPIIITEPRPADMSAAYGIINGVLIALGLWALIAAGLLLYFR